MKIGGCVPGRHIPPSRIMEHYGMAGAVWSILEHSGTFWGSGGSRILEHSGASRSVPGNDRRVNGESGQNIAPTGTRTRIATLEGLNPALGPSLHRKAFLWSVRVCTSQCGAFAPKRSEAGPRFHKAQEESDPTTFAQNDVLRNAIYEG